MPTPDKPRPGQESVWDYPRPPRMEPFAGSITVEFGGQTIAETDRAWRVLETSHPQRITYRGRASPTVSCAKPTDRRGVNGKGGQPISTS